MSKRTKLQIAADKLRTGRPSLGGDARKFNVIVKASEIERLEWARRAKIAGMSLGSWVAKPRRDEIEIENGGGRESR